MRRLTVTLAVLGLLSSAAFRTWAGGDEADAILAKATKAHLPDGKPDKNTGYIGKNKGTLHVQGLELEFEQQVWVQYPPGKFKEVMEMSVMGQAVKTATVFNGKDAWIKVSAGGNNMDIPVKDELLDEFKEVGYMMGLGQLAGLKDKGVKASIVGEAEVNGKKAVGIRITKEGQKDVTLYFDKQTGLLAKTERRAKDFMTGQETTEERIISAYQDIGGRKVAKKVIVNRDGKKLLEADVIEVRTFEKLDDAEFAKP